MAIGERRPFLKLAGTAAVTSIAGCITGRSDAEYPSEDMRLIVHWGAGGTFDFTSRLIAEHMPDHLPSEYDGEIIVENMPGQGGLRGVNEVYNADPDGYTWGKIAAVGMTVAQLVQDVEFNLDEITWLGRTVANSHMLYAGAHTPYETLEDLQEADEVTIGTQGVGGQDHLHYLIGSELMDIDYRVVTGFENFHEVGTAVLREDIDVGLSGPNRDWFVPGIEEGDFVPIIYFGDPPGEWAEAADTLHGTEFERFNSVQGTQFATFAPPGIDEDRLETLRDAFYSTVSSDAYIEDFEESRGPDYEGPLTADEMEQVYENIYETLEPFADQLS